MANDLSLSLQIHARLLLRILQCECAYGAMLPAEHSLCAEYGVSRGTIRLEHTILPVKQVVRQSYDAALGTQIRDDALPIISDHATLYPKEVIIRVPALTVPLRSN